MNGKKISKRVVKNNLTAYSFIIVSLVTLFVLVYIPMFSTVDYSFRQIGMVGYGDRCLQPLPRRIKHSLNPY